MFTHYIDILPFLIASLILIIGPAFMSLKKPISITVVFTTLVFIVAQSSWFTAYIAGDNWGRDWANYLWFMFNTLTMVIFTWTLITSHSK